MCRCACTLYLPVLTRIFEFFVAGMRRSSAFSFSYLRGIDPTCRSILERCPRCV